MPRLSRDLIRRASLALAATSLVIAPVAELHAGQCLPGLCPFSVSGKEGRFIDKGVDPLKLAKNDEILKTAAKGEPLLAAQSVNRGELQGTGLMMPKTERKLEELVDKLRGHWPHRAIGPVKVRIVGTTSLIPLAFSDNVIVVPIGMLMNLETDDQIAWLLAHELGHIALAHFAKEAREKKRKKTLRQILGAVDILTELSQVRVTKVNGKLKTSTVEDKDAIATANSIWANGQILNDALLLAGAFHSRRQEDQADVLGVDLAFAAGYDPEAALSTLGMIAQAEGKTESVFDIIGKQVAEAGKKSGLQRLATVDKNTDLNDMAKGWLRDFADDAVAIAFKEMKKLYLNIHRPTAKREAGVRTYLGRAYLGVPERLPSTKFLKEVRAIDEYVEASRAVGAFGAAMVAIQSNDPAKAKLALAPALTTRYASTPLIANAQAKIFDLQGDLKSADLAYSRANRYQASAPSPSPVARTPKPGGKKKPPATPPPPPPPPNPYLEQNLEGFNSHVTLLIRMAQYQRALDTVTFAKKRYGDDTAFVHQLITIYRMMKKDDEMLAMMDRCVEIVEPEQAKKCNTAMMTASEQESYEALSPGKKAQFDATMNRSVAKKRGGGLMAMIKDATKPKDKKEEVAEDLED